MQHPLFQLREHPTPALMALLTSTTLGTNGAHYRHLDTEQRILELDHPLFLSLERNNKVLGSITFCKRNNNWYIRYFAFDERFQSSGKKQSSGNSLLKAELGRFFEETLEGNQRESIDSFYAYIDPSNVKSSWLADTLGFKTIGKIVTQTFSRVKPKFSSRLHKVSEWEAVAPLVQSTYSSYQHYFEEQTSKPPFYVIKNDLGEIIACAKITTANWEIKRLPGKFGGILTRIIPFIPGLNTIIRPKKHSFVVPEAVYVRDNDPTVLNELFEGILHSEKRHLILWWVDARDALYTTSGAKIQWGILHKFIGVNVVEVVEKRHPSRPTTDTTPLFYTSGIDFI